MPEKEEIIYERRRGTQYIVQNPVQEKTDIGIRMKQGVMAVFKPQSDHNQMGVFNVTRYAEDWVNQEVNSGNLDITNDKAIEKKKSQIVDVLVRFIEGHQDFQTNTIWRKKSKEELADVLRKSIAAQQKALEEMEGKVEDMDPEHIEKIVEPDKAKSDGMIKVGGVIESGSVSNSRTKK